MKNDGYGKSIGTIRLAAAVLGGFLLFAGAASAQAADRDRDYDRQVQYTQWRAHQAAERFGYNSWEAKHWRHENHEAREREKHFWHEHREHRNEYRDYHRDRY